MHIAILFRKPSWAGVVLGLVLKAWERWVVRLGFGGGFGLGVPKFTSYLRIHEQNLGRVHLNLGSTRGN